MKIENIPILKRWTRQWGSLWVAVVALILISALLVFMPLYSSQQPSSHKAPAHVSLATPSPTSTPTVSSPGDWKTYIADNARSGFFWRLPLEETLRDGDFGTTPTLFKTSAGVPMVGLENKKRACTEVSTASVRHGWDGPAVILGRMVALPGGAATESSEPTRYRCYAVALWKGISRVSAGCSFVKKNTSAALMQQMQVWGFPSFLARLVASQSPTLPCMPYHTSTRCSP